MFTSLLDAAFQRALDNGDLDDLPGAGKPIDPGTLGTHPFAHVYRESDVMTPIGVIQRDIDAARARLAAATDPDVRRAIQAELAALDTRRTIEMELFRRYG